MGVGTGVWVGLGSGLGVSVGIGVCVAVKVNVGVIVNVGVRVNLGGRWVAALVVAPDSDSVDVAAISTWGSLLSTVAVSVSSSELQARINANAPLSAIITAERMPRRAQESYLPWYNMLKG